jgi:hypothetical protein
MTTQNTTPVYRQSLPINKDLMPIYALGFGGLVIEHMDVLPTTTDKIVDGTVGELLERRIKEHSIVERPFGNSMYKIFVDSHLDQDFRVLDLPEDTPILRAKINDRWREYLMDGTCIYIQGGNVSSTKVRGDDKGLIVFLDQEANVVEYRVKKPFCIEKFVPSQRNNRDFMVERRSEIISEACTITTLDRRGSEHLEVTWVTTPESLTMTRSTSSQNIRTSFFERGEDGEIMSITSNVNAADNYDVIDYVQHDDGGYDVFRNNELYFKVTV